MAVGAQAQPPRALVLERRIGPAQEARRRRIVEAALALAAEGGYEAVAMKAVAERAGVSLGTLYRYFASKDHLLAEGLLHWGADLARRLEAKPPRGATPAERVARAFRRMARGVAANPRLAIALTRAISSPDAGGIANAAQLRATMAGWLEGALGEDFRGDRGGVIDLLQHVCFSCMLSMVTGARSAREVGEELERAARLLLDPRRIDGPRAGAQEGDP